MNSEPMPPGGVKELLKSSGGRRYLSELQKRHHYDIVQPWTEPRLFEQLYGNKIRRQRAVREQQEIKAKHEWEESKDRKQYAKSKGKKTIFI